VEVAEPELIRKVREEEGEEGEAEAEGKPAEAKGAAKPEKAEKPKGGKEG
jgi:hypothetical protein